MRLSLLDQQQQQQRSGNRASSNSTPNAQPPVLSQRPPTPSQPTNGMPISGACQGSETPERTPHRTPSGAMAAQLANSGNAIAMSVGLPSSSPVTPPQPNLPVAPTHGSRASTSSSSGSSVFANLRDRLTFGKNNDGSRSNEGGGVSASGSRRHRRAESNPTPETAVTGLLGAHGPATAFLQAPNPSSSQQARSAPVSPHASYIGVPPEENEGVPSPMLEDMTEGAKAQHPAPVPAIGAGETLASPSTTPAAAVPLPAPIPVPEPVEHPPATSN